MTLKTLPFKRLLSTVLVVCAVAVVAAQASPASRYVQGSLYYTSSNLYCGNSGCKLAANVGDANYCLSPVIPGTNVARCWSLPPPNTYFNLYARVDSGPGCYYFSNIKRVLAPFDGQYINYGNFYANMRACGGAAAATLSAFEAFLG